MAPPRAPAFVSGLLSPKEGLGRGPDAAEVEVESFAALRTPELSVVLDASNTGAVAVAGVGVVAPSVCPNVNTLGGSAAFTSEAPDPPVAVLGPDPSGANIGGFNAFDVPGTFALPNAEKPVALLSPVILGPLLNAELVLRFAKPAKEDLPLSAEAPALLKPVKTG